MSDRPKIFSRRSRSLDAASASAFCRASCASLASRRCSATFRLLRASASLPALCQGFSYPRGVCTSCMKFDWYETTGRYGTKGSTLMDIFISRIANDKFSNSTKVRN